MAEEKKKPESKGSRRYGHGPKIDAVPKKGDAAGEGSGAPKEAAKEAEKTAGGESAEANMTSDPGPEGAVAAGTEDIPVRHGSEMKEMHARQRKEMVDMHARHRDEHSKLSKRHMAELGPGGDEGEEE